MCTDVTVVTVARMSSYAKQQPTVEPQRTKEYTKADSGLRAKSQTSSWACYLLQPRLIKHAPIGFRVAPGGPAVAGRPPRACRRSWGGVDPAGRSVCLPSATPVPYPALTGGPQNRQIFHPKPGFTPPSCRHSHAPFGTASLVAYAMRIPRSDSLDERGFGRRNRCKVPFAALLGSTLLASPLSTMMRRTW